MAENMTLWYGLERNVEISRDKSSPPPLVIYGPRDDTSTEQNATHFEMSSFQNVTKQKVLGRLNIKIFLK